ncbi:hypothetical protein C8J57DRAFT_1480630 [Mycena rebaudengoi]|nr:hypothetical protein C8J57DRAFT_1480630 [Mycena rebaudengoi]
MGVKKAVNEGPERRNRNGDTQMGMLPKHVQSDSRVIVKRTDNRDIPLSAMDAEIYGSYLSCEYVSASTKSAILEDLSRRAQSESEALVVHTHILPDILQLLEGPIAVDTRIWEAIQPILRGLAERDATAAATCGSLVALLCDSDVPQACTTCSRLSGQSSSSGPPTLTLSVISLLSRIARWREGAEGVVTAKLLDNIRAGLNSLNTDIRLSTCTLLRTLVGHKSTVQAVVVAVPREDIVALLSDRDFWVRERATRTLLKLDATLKGIGSNSCNQEAVRTEDLLCFLV